MKDVIIFSYVLINRHLTPHLQHRFTKGFWSGKGKDVRWKNLIYDFHQKSFVMAARLAAVRHCTHVAGEHNWRVVRQGSTRVHVYVIKTLTNIKLRLLVQQLLKVNVQLLYVLTLRHEHYPEEILLITIVLLNKVLHLSIIRQNTLLTLIIHQYHTYLRITTWTLVFV